MNIYYQGHRERTEIDVIEEQKWKVILGVLWCNSEIDLKTGEVKMTRCPDKCENQWRPKQGKSGQQKQKEEKAKEEQVKKKEEKKQKKKKKQKKRTTIEIKKIEEKQKI